MSYYWAEGVPTIKFNGTTTCQNGNFNCFLSAYNMEMQTPSPCSIRVAVNYDSTTLHLRVKTWVTALDAFSNAHLRYAIAESHKYYPWLGLDSLHHIVRKMLPDFNGVALDINPGETFIDSQSYTLDPVWNDRNCYVVVFVQNDNWPCPVFRSDMGYLFPTYVSGDANGDGIVDVGDVLFLINYLYKGGPAPHPFAAGDTDGSGAIDLGDILYVINYLYKGGPAPC